MPASFAAALCGYRPGKATPNTSDAHDVGSVELGAALLDVLGVSKTQTGPTDVGSAMESAIVAELAAGRPDLSFYRSRSASEFEQYEHLAVYPTFKKGHQSVLSTVQAIIRQLDAFDDGPAKAKLLKELGSLSHDIAFQDELIARLRESMPEESLLKVDITAGAPSGQGESMILALSSKWSLRTDRAQDCVSQGAKLSSQRRGPMPHYAVITMEPRPAMLKLIADNSGAVDCVYHLDLPALAKAIEIVRGKKPLGWSPGLVFDRLVKQRRLRDFDDLVAITKSFPAAS